MKFQIPVGTVSAYNVIKKSDKTIGKENDQGNSIKRQRTMGETL